MALDNTVNFGLTTVSAGYDNVATTIVLTAGGAAKLPTPPYNATWWNSTDFTSPTSDPNREIVRVTGTTTDTCTIVRGQENTTAQTHNAAGKTYSFAETLTAKIFNTDIPATYTAYNSTMTTAGGVAYVSGAGAITEDDVNLHYDSTNKRVGIGLNGPAYPLHVKASGISGYQHLGLESTTADVGIHWVKPGGGVNWSLVATGTGAGQGAGKLIFYRDDFDGASGSVVLDSSGHMGVGIISPTYMLHVYDGGGTGVVAIDSNLNPALVIANSGSPKAYIAVPTGANGDITDSAAGDLCIRSENNRILDSVDAGTSCRHIVRPFKSISNNVATTVFSLTVANNTGIMARLMSSAEVVNGTDVQTDYKTWLITATNKAGTVSAAANQAESQGATTGGTISHTISVSNANPVVVQITVNSSLASITAGYPRITMTLENFSRQAIGPA